MPNPLLQNPVSGQVATAAIASIKTAKRQRKAVLKSMGLTESTVKKIRPSAAVASLPTVKPLSPGEKTAIDLKGQSSGTLDPTRTGTNPGEVADIQQNSGGPGVSGYHALSAILGPDLAAHVPGTTPPPGAGRKTFGLSRIGPIPIPSGMGVDVAMLPFMVPKKGFDIAREGERLIEEEAVRAGGGKVRKTPPVRRFKVGGHTAEIPAAKSRTGRVIEKAIDASRPVLSKAGVLKSETEKAGQANRQFRKTQQGVLEGPVLALRKASKHLNRPEEYALRVVAEGASPQARVEHHLGQIATAPHTSSALYHGEHARLSHEAEKYVTTDPETGGAVLRPDAPKKLQESWHWFQQVGQGREQLLKEMGRLDDARIAARAIAPARVIHGARYKTFEQIVGDALEGSKPREDLHAAIDSLVRNPVRAQAIKDAVDGLSRSAAERAGNPLEAGGLLEHIGGVKTGVHEEELPPEALALFQGGEHPGSDVFRAHAGEDLAGLPGAVKHEGQALEVHSNVDAQSLAGEYMHDAGLPYDPPRTYAEVNEARAKRIAHAYEEMKHDPGNPDVQSAYDAMIRETAAQYERLKGAGYRFEFYPESDPYPAGPRQAMLDLAQNKHLYIFPTEAGFGTEHTIADHPLLADSGERWGAKPVTHNDIFRAVHDVFGHFKEGVGFRAAGEENAWRQHSAMYSPDARRAMTTETRGQNSWVNYGPHGAQNRDANQLETVYADQKAGLLPDWVVREGSGDHQVPTHAPSEGFYGAAAGELDTHAALARDVAQTMPESEWPAWVKNQMDDQFGVARAKPISWEPYPPSGKNVPDTLPEGWNLQRGSVNQDPHTGTVVGGINAPSSYGVKGAIEFTPKNTAIIHLTTAADETTFIHELAHLVRRFAISSKEEPRIAKWAGAKPIKKFVGRSVGGRKKFKTVGYAWDRTAEERFARGVEAYVRTGRGPEGLRQAFTSLEPAFHEVYEHTDLPDVPQKVAKFFDKLFGYKPLKGGMIHGVDDITYSVEYAPVFRGMPIRPLTQPHKAMASYIRRTSEALFGGGRRTAIGTGPRDVSLEEEYRGSNLLSGLFKADVVGPKVQSAIIASRMAGAFLARKVLLEAGSKLPQAADDIAVKIDPSKNIAGKNAEALKALWDKLDSVERTGVKIGAKKIEGTSFDLIESARQSVFEWTGSADARLESEKMAKEAMASQQPIDNIVWVPKEFIDESGLLHVPKAALAQQRGISKTQRRAWQAAGLGVDAANDFVKASILYLNPSYVPVQFVGNLGMALLQQGFLMPRNLWRAGTLHRSLEAIDRVTIDHLMQHGIFSSTSMYTGLGEFIKQTFGKWANAAADWLPRRAAFLHEAYREGLDTKDIAHLLSQARLNDESALKTLNLIVQRANAAMVDFDRMTPLERETINRIVFFYPWIRGATHYSARFMADHPVESIAIALAVDHMLVASQEQLGERPYANQLDIPLSTESAGFSIPGTDIGVGLDRFVGKHAWIDKNNPMTASLRQLLTFTTPADLIQTGIAFAGLTYNPQAATNLAQNLTPVPYAAGVALFGKDPFTGRETTPSASTFLSQLSPSTQSPLYAKIKALTRAVNDKSIHPRGRNEKLWNIFGGSIAPAPYNVEVGQQRALEYKPLLERRQAQLLHDSALYGLGVPSPEVVDDLIWETKLDQAVKNGMTPLQRAQVAAQLFDERYGTAQAQYVAQATTMGQAEAIYTLLRARLAPAYAQWEHVLAARQNASERLQPTG